MIWADESTQHASDKSVILLLTEQITLEVLPFIRCVWVMGASGLESEIRG